MTNADERGKTYFIYKGEILECPDCGEKLMRANRNIPTGTYTTIYDFTFLTDHTKPRFSDRAICGRCGGTYIRSIGSGNFPFINGQWRMGSVPNNGDK